MLPPELSANDRPMIVYSLTDPIRGKIFNYTKFVFEIRYDNFYTNPNLIPCHCQDYAGYVDSHHGHVLSGDLNIVSDPILRKLISKGPKY